MDRGAWWATVHGITGSWRWLSDEAQGRLETFCRIMGSKGSRNLKVTAFCPTRTLTLIFHTCLAENWTFFRVLLPLWLSPGPGPPFTLPSGGDSDGKESACNVGNLGLIPELGRSPRGGHGNPLHYFSWRILMDRGAWWATVQGVAKSWKWLSD